MYIYMYTYMCVYTYIYIYIYNRQIMYTCNLIDMSYHRYNVIGPHPAAPGVQIDVSHAL